MRIRYMTPGGEPRVADLFGTLAALVRDEVDDFPALRAHQRAPWHAFLAQVAALALLREGTRELPEEAGAWERLLLALTPDHPGGEAWRLVVDDWSKPALLQPPGMDPKLRKNPKAKRAETPDALDMLLTARNHDLKGERMRHAADDAWLFALVSLQTQEGQMGAGNYGVSRMNGGYGARVAFSLQPSEPTPGRSFGRDVRRLAAATEDAGGIALIWLERWDGASSIPFGKLHPLYVEVCRRVRLIGGEDGIAGALLGNSKVPRIAAKERHGVTGDPWAPVFHDRSKAWGVSAAGFGYRQMTTLLDGKKVQRPPLAIPSAADSRTGLTLVARAVTRGQGKTEGYHERHVRVPPADVGLMAAGSDRLANTAEKRTKDAGDAANILRHALRTLFQGGPDEVRHDDDATNAKLVPDVQSFDRAVDAVFFDGAFWKAATQTGEDVAQRHILAWRERLRDIAGNILRGGASVRPRATRRAATERWRGRAACSTAECGRS
ncbi:MAG: type I-E CRISPR-associated protein Cse1/CasA [Myxococcota bacterium]